VQRLAFSLPGDLAARTAPAEDRCMKIAFVIFEGMTGLDLVGAFDPVTRLKTMQIVPDLQYDICATIGDVRDASGLAYRADRICGPFDGYDMVVLPGGNATRQLVDDVDFIGWIRTAAACPHKVSVCTGGLLWGAAGFLQGKRATTHPTAFAALAKYGATVVDDRVVEDSDVITARGVTSSIDLGLYLVEKIAGPAAREKIATQMDYPYRWAPA
jgi:transcriptional regulator GlxA family with amidase domain